MADIQDESMSSGIVSTSETNITAGTLQRSITDITIEVRFYKAQAASNFIEIGKRLIEAKKQLGHGQWGEWLINEVEFSERSARRFMRLAAEYSNLPTSASLPPSKLDEMLVLEFEDRPNFQAHTHEIDGKEKTVSEMSVRELRKAVANYKAEKIEKEAFERRLKEKEASIESANANAVRLAADKTDLEKRLHAAESRPVDVAVREPNEEEKEALRREGYDQARNEIVISKATPVAILEDPYTSFIAQIDGAVSVLLSAVSYMPDNSGLSLLISAKDVLCEKEAELMRAYDKLMGFVRSQNPRGFDLDF